MKQGRTIHRSDKPEHTNKQTDRQTIKSEIKYLKSLIKIMIITI